MTAFTTIYHDRGLLPFWLRYYAQHGVDKFVLISQVLVNNLPPNCELVMIDGSFVNGGVDVDLILAAATKRLKQGEWFVIADLDEFHWFSSDFRFKQFEGNFDCIKTSMVDRISANGQIVDILPNRSLSEQFPLEANITGNIAKGATDKIAALRLGAQLTAGHHYVRNGVPAPFAGHTYHFKWSAKNHLIAHLQSRALDPRNKYRDESIRVLAYLAGTGGIRVNELICMQSQNIGV